MSNIEREKMDNLEQIFKDHEIEVIVDTPEVQRYKFSKPGTWMYGFFLTFSDNLIVLNGDIGTMIVEPGYGRNGLTFLRGSINSLDYVWTESKKKIETLIKENRPDIAHLQNIHHSF